MPFLKFLELIVTLFLLYLISTQIVWPSLAGGKMFPLFRRQELESRHRTAEEDLARTKEEIQIDALKEEIERLRTSHHKESK